MDRDFLIDLFSDFGPVTIRPMFSGFGISADGTNFAMALSAGLYFRADEQSIPQFEAEGSKPFQYQTRDKTVTVGSYWQLPARLFDDPEELAGWARAALAAFCSNRIWSVNWLKSLTPDQLAKALSHPERGELTLCQLLEVTAGHDLNHLRQFKQVVAAKAGY